MNLLKWLALGGIGYAVYKALTQPSNGVTYVQTFGPANPYTASTASTGAHAKQTIQMGGCGCQPMGGRR